MNDANTELVLVGRSDTEGKFEFALTASDFNLRSQNASVIAIAEGFGLDWADIRAHQIPSEATLTLVDELPIRGRILDSEGREFARGISDLSRVEAEDLIEKSSNGSTKTRANGRASVLVKRDNIVILDRK